MTDWPTISSLATAGGTLVLAVATFVSVRSANRAARTAERALQAGLRPVLVPSRMTDPPEKIMWSDQHWARVEGGHANVEFIDGIVYLAMSVRNVGAGIAVIHGWDPSPDWLTAPLATHPPPEEFRPQQRDLYIPAGDSSFWQGAIREQVDPDYESMSAAVQTRQLFRIDLLYGDHEGGQRTITRFGIVPREGNGAGWLCSVSKHWNLDRRDPR
jgi:hypothetical protein